MQREALVIRRFPHTQTGAALLVFMLAAVIVALTVLLNRSNLPSNASVDSATTRSLALAKEAIIGWSASDDTTPGKLPCPEDVSLIGTALEGRAKSSCSNSVLEIGRLPWRTLGLPPLRDAAGEPLWYALSPGFRNSPINSDTLAQISVDGVSGSAVAIIFAPGTPVTGQNRPEPTAVVPPDITQYLESTNNNGTGNFVTKDSAVPFNDVLQIISARDLFSVVEKRVAREVRRELLNFFCGVNNFTDSGTCIAAGGNLFFPRPADFNDSTCLGSTAIPTNCGSGTVNNAGRIPANPASSWEPPASSLLRGTILSSPNWFQKNGWREHVYYAVANACINGTSNCNGSGMLTVIQPPHPSLDNQRVVIIVGGSALSTTTPAQTRSTTSNKLILSNYLEDENLTPLDDVYTFRPPDSAATFNDQLLSLP